MAAETVPLIQFSPLVLPFAPTLPLPVMTRLVRHTAIEFCERTRCWREIIDITVDERTEHQIAPAHAAIHRIEQATFNKDIILEPTQFSDTTQMQREENAQPRYITQVNYNSITLIPYAPGNLQLSVFLKPIEGTAMQLDAIRDMPLDDYDVAPKFLLTQFGEAIAAGTLARALMHPGQAYSDPNKAMMYAAKFREACDGNFASNIEMQHSPPPRVRMHEY